MIKKLPVVAVVSFFLTFLGVFFYFYRNSGNFRKSVTSALLATVVVFSGPSESQAQSADAFTQQNQQHQSRPQNHQGIFGRKSSNNGPGKPNNNGSDGDKGLPQYPKAESVQETEKRVENIGEFICRMEESSDSEEEQCEVVEMITSVVSKDGSITKVSSSQVQDKGKHIPEFLSKGCSMLVNGKV